MLAKTIDAMQSDAFARVSLTTARATIASCFLGDEPAQLRVGDITLHPHQRSAVARLQRTLCRHGGALLCDDVGLGKTYVALALANAYDSITIVAPAALAPMWREALSATHLAAEFISAESLGRSGAAEHKRALLIVDEAHHFRNPCTRRYAALARMCMLTPALLLSATPLHNSRDDLSAIAALFKGSRAYAMTNGDLAQIIVRRDSAGGLELGHVPVVVHAPARVIITDETVLDMILALPAPVPPSDGSVATRLVILGLVRQWASSNAALIGALKRRIARSHGLLVSLDAGRYPTAAELSAWVYTGDAVQLAFAELLLPATTPLVALAAALRQHVHALTALLAFARELDDDALAVFTREIRAAHPDQKIIAFSCYAETAEALYKSLKRDGHVGLLTARGAMIASGPVDRAEILAQFAPNTTTTRVANDHANVNLLVATDLLSEGVNLQEASILINLDLPWTAARLEQRIGRLARIGSRHQRVVSYSVTPPQRAEQFLHELEIIARKSDISAQLFGGSAIGQRVARPDTPETIKHGERVRAIIDKWRGPDSRMGSRHGTPVAVAHGTRFSALGSWLVDGTPTLLACDESGRISTDPPCLTAVTGAVDVADDAGGDSLDAARLANVVRAANAWYEQRCAWLAVGGADGSVNAPVFRDSQRSLARVADAATANTSFARRSQTAATATRLRIAAATPLPLAVEWSLESLADSPDDAAVNTILDLVDCARPPSNRVCDSGIRCVALILFAAETIAR